MNFWHLLLSRPRSRRFGEAYHTLKRGGTAVFLLWKEFALKPVLWKVQERVQSANSLTELSLVEPWCDGALLRRKLQEEGFTGIEMTEVTEGMWGTGRKDLESVFARELSGYGCKQLD